MQKWIKEHPYLWEFIMFNILANIATVTNFVLMWICTGFLFVHVKNVPFRFFVFDYTSPESLMLCGFLSFLIATVSAQIVNYFVQKKLVFKSNANFSKAAPKYLVLVIVLVIVSAALPGYTQKILSGIGISKILVPTVANVVNIFVQVLISYPSMKWWIMTKKSSYDIIS